MMEPQESSAVSLLKESKKGSGLVIRNMAWPSGWDHTLRTTVLPAGPPSWGQAAWGADVQPRCAGND